MRSKILLFALLCSVALLSSCEKDVLPESQTIQILKEKEKIEIGVDSVSIRGEYAYPGLINSLKLKVSEEEHLHGADDYQASLNGKSYTVSITGLEAGTLYYYCYIADFGAMTDWHSEVYTFTTATELPIVQTLEVLMIDSLMARVKGAVSYEGGATVTERGVCWNDYGDPTTDDNRLVHAENGLGEYTCKLTGLEPFTKYYVRAYAKNTCGTSYGAVLDLVTGAEVNLPTVVTVGMNDVSVTTASCLCNVVDDGGAPVYERGACWGIDPNPNIASYVYADGGGLGDYVIGLNELDANTTYYVRAYAKNSKGINYGETICFSTLEYIVAPLGALDGRFSVAENRQVWFSQGNLQYNPSLNEWRFSENQFDYIGESNANASEDYPGWLDLFAWGTSGYNHGAISYQPWSTINITGNYLAYGNENSHLYDQTGMADWGYNAISNGGNTESQWRTLTDEEWDFILHYRSTPSGIRFAKAQVEGVNGLILLPDDWSSSMYHLNNVNQINASFGGNVMQQGIWESYLQHYGAIFLPAAGRRSDLYVEQAGSIGSYQTSVCRSLKYVYNVMFSHDDIEIYTVFRNFACSVRLVQDVGRR